MRDLFAGAAGQRMLGEVYVEDFDANFRQTGKSGFWKLERLQVFREPSDDSWVAFNAGNWHESLDLLERRRSELTRHYDNIRAHGFETWRIRVVEHPLTDYMRWELSLLGLRDELGGHTRVIDINDIREFEADGVILPEVVTLGDRVVYRLLYDETGLQEGAVRYGQPALVARWREFIQRLYARGEEISDYLERNAGEVALVEHERR
jgi:hypothetical protein